MDTIYIKRIDEGKRRKRKNERINRTIDTLITKAYEVGEFDGIDVALAISKHGRYTTYRSRDHASWLPFMAEIVNKTIACLKYTTGANTHLANCLSSPWSLWEVWEGRRHKRILFSKQNSKISRVSCVPKPSQIKMRGLLLARSLVSGSNIRLSHSKLILESVYPESEYAYCHPGVGNVVQLLRWVTSVRACRKNRCAEKNFNLEDFKT